LEIPLKKYNIIYADPPWNYEDKLNHHGGGAGSHYDEMSLKEICDLPIKNLIADDCTLFIWGTWPQLREVNTVISCWGFNYKTIGFVWLKEYSNGKMVNGMGNWTRGNTEFCLIGTSGKPKRINNNISQILKTIPKQHSQKPDIIREKIVQLMGDLPRIELFARTKIHGWDVWGNDKKLLLEPLEKY